MMFNPRIAIMATILVNFIVLIIVLIGNYGRMHMLLNGVPEEWEHYKSLSYDLARWLYNPAILILSFAFAKGGMNFSYFEQRTRWTVLDAVASLFILAYALVPLIVYRLYFNSNETGIQLEQLEELLTFLRTLLETLITIFLGFYFAFHSSTPHAAAQPNIETK